MCSSDLAPWLPRRLGDKDIVTWLNRTTFFDQPLTAQGARLVANLQTTGARGGHDLHYRVLRDLGVFGRVECEDPTDPSPCAAQGQATGIKERGQVVGWSQDSSGVHRPFLYQDGQLRDLGIFPGENVQPVAINQRGQIAGTHWRYGPAGLQSGAFLWDGGTLQDLGSLGPAIAVTALNERGGVVGWSGASWFTAHAVVWRDGVTYDLGLGPAGGD